MYYILLFLTYILFLGIDIIPPIIINVTFVLMMNSNGFYVINITYVNHHHFFSSFLFVRSMYEHTHLGTHTNSISFKTYQYLVCLKQIFKEGYFCTSILYMVILRQLFFLFGDLEFNMIYIAVIMDKNVFRFF